MIGCRRRNPASRTIFSAQGAAFGAAVRAMLCCRKTTGGYPMRILSVAAVIMLLASPAFAQLPPMNLLADRPSKTQDEKDAEAARDKAYQDTLKKIPDGKPPADPWGNVRSTDAPKAPAKAAASAKPKTKTGSTAN